MITEFLPEHLTLLKLQPHQVLMDGVLSVAYGKTLQDAGSCFTCMQDGKVLACSGVMEAWEGRYIAWALIANEALNPRVFIEIHHAVKRFLDLPKRRVEAYVHIDHEKAHRWIEKLGFKLECSEMKSFMPNGSSVAMYARVN